MEIADPPTDPVRSSRILESSVGRGRGRWKFKNDNTFGRAKIPRLSIFIDFVGKKETIREVTITENAGRGRLEGRERDATTRGAYLTN